jgi:hypothetical protein
MALMVMPPSAFRRVRTARAHGGATRAPAGDQGLVTVLHEPYVVEPELQLRLRDVDEVHPDGDLVERGDLGEELAVHLQGEQLQVVPELSQDLRGALLEEHLPAPALPAQVVRVIDVADDVGVLEPDRVPVLEVAAVRADHA